MGVLEVRDVAKRWGPRPVLERIDLALPAGRLVRIKGANGAGKTTLLRIVAGLMAPDRGSVRLGGLDPESDRQAFLARLGFVSAGDRGLYARLSARGNLELAARLGLLPPGPARVAVAEAIELFGLQGHADRRADRTSLGQRQRTRLAVAFVHGPQLVLLDEPATSLDDPGIEILAAAPARLRDRGGAAVVAEPATAGPALDFDERHVLERGVLRAE